MIKVKLGATIPVVQYGNLMPEVEVEAESYEEAFAEAENHIKKLWNKYVEDGKQLPDNNRVKLTAFVGGDIYYDRVAHVYTNESGEVYLSGSVYADSFKKPFDKQKIALAMAKKYSTGAHEVSSEEIIAMWDLNAEASRSLGTAIHAALQLEEQYRALGVTLGKSSIHDHSVLKNAVEGFVEGHKDEKAMNEVLVVDHKTKRAGQIDRLVVSGDKYIIDDFKTSSTLKDLEFYWKQLSFYGYILFSAGLEVEKLRVHHYNGKWTTYEKEFEREVNV